MSEIIKVPDLGSSEGEVIELLVSVGQQIEAEQSLLTLESDKASMEIPSPYAGTIKKLLVKLGDKLKEGDPLLELERAENQPSAPLKPETASPQQDAQAPASNTPTDPTPEPKPSATAEAETTEPPIEQIAPQVELPPRASPKVHAGPAVRLLAREFGVDLEQVNGSGPKQRILKEDLQQFVKQRLAQPSAAGIAPIPTVDFSRFGEIEQVAMTRLQQVAATNLQRNWLNVPQVTQFEQADITELEAFRQAQKAEANAAGVKLTLLPFLLKACAYLLQEMPDFNSSLAPDGKHLIRKKYCHIGFAVDTPEGLLVPVIRDVAGKSLLELAQEAAELAQKAREKKLSAEAMQGGCFTISSLGHIGGTGFTPLVNAPQVAILGVSQARMQPMWDGQSFQPRLMLPLSLSYDHRVINGAAAAQFSLRLANVLADIRKLLL